jgi:phosphohistidine phosphatase
MDLYLIRHAEAVSLGEQDINDDADRPLTSKGEGQARELGAALKRHNIRLDKVLASTLLRAQQTAEGMLSTGTSPSPELVSSAQLAPGGRKRKLARFLNQLGANAVALVGHQPDLDILAAWLIGSKKTQLEIAKGGIAYIVCSGPVNKRSGSLAWLLTPEWFCPPAEGAASKRPSS